MLATKSGGDTMKDLLNQPLYKLEDDDDTDDDGFDDDEDDDWDDE